jgi:hypothetical protein
MLGVSGTLSCAERERGDRRLGAWVGGRGRDQAAPPSVAARSPEFERSAGQTRIQAGAYGRAGGNSFTTNEEERWPYS